MSDPAAAVTYPATVIVHWPSGPEPACDTHAERLVALGRFLGVHVVASPVIAAAECANCRNEAGA